MDEWFHLVTKNAVLVIETMALIIVLVGTVEALLAGLLGRIPSAGATPE